MTINNIDDYANYLGITTDCVERAIYKSTDCGAWITWNDDTITIGSIVEGSDAEFAKTFHFPTSTNNINAWLDELDSLTNEAWLEANEYEED